MATPAQPQAQPAANSAAPSSSAGEKPEPVNVLRSLIFVPAIRAEMLTKARSFAADALVLDLEDSVPLDAKEQARQQARAALPDLQQRGRQLWARINSTYSLLTKADVRAVVAPGLDGLVIPKVDKPEQVYYVEGLLRDAEPAAGIEPGSLRLILVIESAVGLLAAVESARASRRTVALQFGAEDYAADLGIDRTPEGTELAYARGAIAVAAAGTRMTALDTVYPLLNDAAGLERETRLARSLGYRGKFAIHPEQIATINSVFTPSAAEVERARRIVAAYDEAGKAGHGAVQVDGAMVDAPVAQRARRLAALAEAIANIGAGAANEAPTPEQAPAGQLPPP